MHCVNMVQCTTILLLALQTFVRQGTKLFAVENLLQGAMQFMEPIKDTMHSWLWAAQVPISTESGRHRYLNLVKQVKHFMGMLHNKEQQQPQICCVCVQPLLEIGHWGWGIRNGCLSRNPLMKHTK